MPELPDVTIYIEALEKRILGQRLENLRIVSPFLLRSVEPPVGDAIGKKVVELRRLGKRICIGLGPSFAEAAEGAALQKAGLTTAPAESSGTGQAAIWLVLHLMIAGRLHWKEGPPRKAVATRSANHGPKLSKLHLAAFDFSNGSLLWTEAGSQKRASLYLARGEEGLAEFDRGGLEIFSTTKEEFAKVLRSENHTLKRALTDPEWFSGIGNAYSDEILWEAKLSPLLQTQKMKDEEIARLFDATRKSLAEWTKRLRAETGDGFPEGVTAFRQEMAVHGKYKQDCPRCGAQVQRIKYASNETNYCPRCQTGGKLLADRAISRLLREDWPKTPDELELKKMRTRMKLQG
jgi:formamidopyrimidine-DNA glycosylase